MLANVFIPVFMPTAFWMVVTLVPVVLLESCVVSGWLRLPARVALRASFTINGASTLVGIPLSVVLFWLFGPIASWMMPRSVDEGANWVHDAVLQAPFLLLPRDDAQFTGPTATFTLLVVLFVLTVLVETWVARRALPNEDPLRRRTAILVANGLSYCCLAALVGFIVARAH